MTDTVKDLTPSPPSGTARLTRSDTNIAQPRKIPAGALWAALGAAFVLLQIYIFAAWIASGPESTPAGPTPIPTYMKIGAIVLQTVVPLVSIIGLYYWVYKPWRREGRIGFDGLLTIAVMSTYWQDPIANYSGVMFTYNSYYVNLGSWTEQIPGWNNPLNQGKVPEPLLHEPFNYIYLLVGLIILSNHIMRKAQQRWNLSPGKVILSFFVMAFVADFVIEPIYMIVFGAWTYAGVPRLGTAWYGHRYQMPMIESLFWGAVWAVWASLRYFRNDKGQTVVEAGVEKLRIGQKQKTWVRALALIGALNLSYLLLYNVPMGSFFASRQNTWPEDIRNKSYFVSGACGEGTKYMCPGRAAPSPHKGSGYLNPEGKLVFPPGVKLPYGVQTPAP